MKDVKNYVIALLVGLLVISIATRPMAGTDKVPIKDEDASQSAKAIEYDRCLSFYTQEKVAMDFYRGYPEAFTFYLDMCSKYKP